jgi:hypothetical protein
MERVKGIELVTIAGSSMVRGHGEFSVVLEVVEFQLLSAWPAA